MNEYAKQVFELRKQQAPWESEFLQSVEEGRSVRVYDI